MKVTAFSTQNWPSIWGSVHQHHAGSEPDAGILLQDALLAPPAQPTPTNNFPAPLYQLHNYAREPRTRRLLVQVRATYKFTDELSLSVRGSREQAEARALGHLSNNSGASSTTFVQSDTATTTNQSGVIDAALRYQHTFGAQHAFTASLNYLRQHFERTLERTTRVEYGSLISRSGYHSSIKSANIHSPSANLGYTYAGRYEVQASLRTDFALGQNNSKSKSYWFPGVQLSWHLNKESFLSGTSGLSDLTLWAGTGQTRTYFLSDRTTHHDAGLRLGMLGGRLTLEAGIYQRRTQQAQAMLLVPASYVSGTYELVRVFPEITLLNRGLELTLGSTWQVGPVAGTTQLAAATNRNQVETTSYPLSAASLFQGLEPGQPVGRFYTFEKDGTYPTGSPDAGQIRFRDRNNDGKVDYADGYYQGNRMPRYTLNLCQQLHLLRFHVAAQLDGLFGYQLLNNTLVTLDTPTGKTNSSDRALDFWSPNYQDTSVPQPGSYPSGRLSTQSLASGDHVRLSQLTLSYGVLTTGPRRASVWVGGQNLFVTGSYRGFDPNVSSGGAAPLHAGQDISVYPVARVWQVGVRGSF